jgi:hypothetical protein
MIKMASGWRAVFFPGVILYHRAAVKQEREAGLLYTFLFKHSFCFPSAFADPQGTVATLIHGNCTVPFVSFIGTYVRSLERRLS